MGLVGEPSIASFSWCVSREGRIQRAHVPVPIPDVTEECSSRNARNSHFVTATRLASLLAWNRDSTVTTQMGLCRSNSDRLRAFTTNQSKGPSILCLCHGNDANWL